jgi:hypothetical protein
MERAEPGKAPAFVLYGKEANQDLRRQIMAQVSRQPPSSEAQAAKLRGILESAVTAIITYRRSRGDHSRIDLVADAQSRCWHQAEDLGSATTSAAGQTPQGLRVGSKPQVGIGQSRGQYWQGSVSAVEIVDIRR